MYIEPFWLGVAATIGIQMTLIVAAIVCAVAVRLKNERKAKRKKDKKRLSAPAPDFFER